MKILKILSLYHVRFRNYDHLKYGPFSLDTEPSTFLVILKLLLFSHFYQETPEIWTGTSFSGDNSKNHGGELKLSKLLLQCFSFHPSIFRELQVDKAKCKCVRTHCGNALPGVLLVKTSFMHILAYLVELGATKVGPRHKNDILGKISQTKKSMLAICKRF